MNCKCGKPISPKTKSGRCAKCAAADPAVRAKKGQLTPEQREARAAHARQLSADKAVVAKRSASMAATQADPAFRKRLGDICRAARAERMKDPAFRALMVEHGHRYGKPNLVPSTPEQRARAGKSIQRRALAWCPEEYWDLNVRLKRQGFRLPERKAIILAEVEGTPEHARRTIANNQFAGELKHARDLAQRY